MLPDGVGLTSAIDLGRDMGKMNIITSGFTEQGFDWNDRFNIFSGSTDGVVSPNSDNVPIVASWLPGTDVEKAMKAIIALEKELSRLKKEISAAKRALAQTLLR